MLIGCSKEKTYTYDKARGGVVYPKELYSSDLFKKRVAYAESRNIRWVVLSAYKDWWDSDTALQPGSPLKGGKEKDIKPYNLTLRQLSPMERAFWYTKIIYHATAYADCVALKEEVAEVKPKDFTFEIHAGRLYAHPTAELLTQLGFNVELPVKGLGVGQQLKWYADRLAKT